MTQAMQRWLRGTTEPLATLYDVALLDLDGVVYVGPEPIPGVREVLAKARDAGLRLAFVTNNASRSPATVAAHLVDLGVPAVADEVVTSSQAAASVVRERLGAGATVLVTGSPALREIVEEAGLHPVDTADDRPDAVVQGFSPDTRYADLAEATIAVRAGALWVATNADSTLPSPRGLLPGNGSLVGVVATATGKKPIIAGKPELPLHAEGVRRLSARHPLVVGDRLDTDIEGANAAYTDSLLVLTGVTSALELAGAPAEHRPTYVSADLTGLLEPQPSVEGDTNLRHCGASCARRKENRIEIAGDGPPIDALRALLALVWAAGDAGEQISGVAEAIAGIELG